MPIIAFSLTSDTMPQTDLWEIANYTIKPRLNRVNGVSMVVLQGGDVPEFQIEPDPAKLLQAQVTVSGILRRRLEKQHDRFTGFDRKQSRALLDFGQRPDARSGSDWEHCGPHDSQRRAGADRRHRRRTLIGHAGVHHRDRQRQAGRAAECFPPARQQHVGGVGRGESRARSDPEDASPGHQAADLLRSVGDGARVDQQRAGRHPHRADPGRYHSGSVSAGLGQFARGGAGDSGDDRHYADRAAVDGAEPRI